jgi:hypothetical protein
MYISWQQMTGFIQKLGCCGEITRDEKGEKNSISHDISFPLVNNYLLSFSICQKLRKCSIEKDKHCLCICGACNPTRRMIK